MIKIKKLTLKQLKQLNKKSDYNRRLDWCAFYEENEKACLKLQEQYPDYCYRRMNTVIALQVLMFHEHKSGVPCELHYRCEIVTAPALRSVLFDISVEDFESLEDVPSSQLPDRFRSVA